METKTKTMSNPERLLAIGGVAMMAAAIGARNQAPDLPQAALKPATVPSNTRSASLEDIRLQSLGTSLMRCTEKRRWLAGTVWKEIELARDFSSVAGATCATAHAYLACVDGTPWRGDLRAGEDESYKRLKVYLDIPCAAAVEMALEVRKLEEGRTK